MKWLLLAAAGLVAGLVALEAATRRTWPPVDTAWWTDDPNRY